MACLMICRGGTPWPPLLTTTLTIKGCGTQTKGWPRSATPTINLLLFESTSGLQGPPMLNAQASLHQSFNFERDAFRLCLPDELGINFEDP